MCNGPKSGSVVAKRRVIPESQSDNQSNVYLPHIATKELSHKVAPVWSCVWEVVNILFYLYNTVSLCSQGNNFNYICMCFSIWHCYFNSMKSIVMPLGLANYLKFKQISKQYEINLCFLNWVLGNTYLCSSIINIGNHELLMYFNHLP